AVGVNQVEVGAHLDQIERRLPMSIAYVAHDRWDPIRLDVIYVGAVLHEEAHQLGIAAGIAERSVSGHRVHDVRVRTVLEEETYDVVHRVRMTASQEADHVLSAPNLRRPRVGSRIEEDANR